MATPRSAQTSRHESEIHVFLLWSNALPKADRILADIRSRFTVLDVISVEWSREKFATNLTRFYGQTLPPGSEKELHCGADPFLVVVVEDLRPNYALRKTLRGKVVLNARMFDAKRRYRRWTGRGHRVHATVNPREADKDLFLLLGRRADFYRSGPRQSGHDAPTSLQRDLTGADGWQSRPQLLAALETVTGCVVIGATAAVPTRDAEGLRLLVDNVWWAARIANGSRQSDTAQRVQVAGRELSLVLSEVGDGSLDPTWQHVLFSTAVRDRDGVLVPRPLDRFYLALHDIVTNGLELERERQQALVRLAQELSLPPGDYTNSGAASAALNAYLTQLEAPPDEAREAIAGSGRILPLTRLLRRVAGPAGS
jgi:hypothetical protein